MRSLTFPHHIAPDPIDTIRLAFGQGRDLTAPEEANLRSAFELYEHYQGRGDLIAPSDHFKGALGTDFRTAYNQTYDKKRLDKMRVALKALAANRCPRCGGSRPGTLDHHLPKADYAEFSVYPMNLLACCQECNGKKSTAVGGTPEEAFLHPYYDVIPAVSFIKVDLEVTELGTSAAVSFDDNSHIGDALLKARMKYQFDKVDVNARIASEIVEYISEKAGTIAITVGEHGSEAVKAFLLRAAELADASYTVGSWQSALLRALSQSDPFCNGGFKAMVPGGG